MDREYSTALGPKDGPTQHYQPSEIRNSSRIRVSSTTAWILDGRCDMFVAGPKKHDSSRLPRLRGNF